MINNSSTPGTCNELAREQTSAPPPTNPDIPPLVFTEKPRARVTGVSVGVAECPMCHRREQMLQIREMSGVQIFWGCMLFCTAPVICWLPFCLSRCDDRRTECHNCNHIYDYHQSTLCPYF